MPRTLSYRTLKSVADVREGHSLSDSVVRTSQLFNGTRCKSFFAPDGVRMTCAEPRGMVDAENTDLTG